MSLELIEENPDFYRILVFLGNIEEDNSKKINYYGKALEKDP